MENKFKGRVIFSENYQSTIDSIKLINKSANKKATISKISSDTIDISKGASISIISGYEKISVINEDNLIPPKLLSAYDESILELNSLEGKVRCIAHSAVIQTDKEYIPSGYVTLKFYTKSDLIGARNTEYSDIIQSKDINSAQIKEYVEERKYFLEKAAPNNALMLIDGPMFSGATTSGNFILINQLLKQECRPIFFVKNSDSTIITENFKFAKGYNSDLHWAYSTLKEKEISQVFAYTSEGRSKAMCFMKIYNNRGPVRIEFPLDAFEQGWYNDDVFDQIYYQYLANGSANNMQPRIIQIAEMYAREILKSTNLYKDIERMGLTKSMNEERGHSF